MRVEVDMFFLALRFLLDEHKHELPEQLTHGVHALLTSLHIVKGMAHDEEHCLHYSSVRCVVKFRIALGNIRDGNEVGSGLKVVKTLFKTFQSRNTAKGEVLCLSQFVLGCHSSKEQSCIPVYIFIQFSEFLESPFYIYKILYRPARQARQPQFHTLLHP